MKKFVFVLIAGLFVATPLPAQVVISSFNQGGQLTWTNFFTNATYRVEWAGSPTGPWQSLDVLTNLTLLSATSNSVTVGVPTFYRVLWLNPPAPQPEGTWNYRAWDKQGTLVVTGRLALAYQPNHVDLAGTRSLDWTGNPSTSSYETQIGTGDVLGRLTGDDLFIDLNHGASDDNVYLRGQMFGGYAFGNWDYSGFAGESVEGKFVAIKAP